MKIPVDNVARLARLTVSEAEKEQFSGQLDSILGYVEQLNQIDTTGIEPTSHVLQISNVMREDYLAPSLSKEDALGNAPDRAGDFYRVPRIIE